jgi:lipid II:glycine glycyltransferase (peptidoglycan interpeptide bridge formation enzyme)
MGGLVGAGQAAPEDVAEVFADLRRQRVMHTSIRPNPLQAEAWATARPPGVVSTARLGHVLDLDGGFGQVWTKRFKGVTRTAVRKAEKSDLVIERDTTGRLLSAYYRLFQLSLDRWAARQHEPRTLSQWRGRRRDPQRKLEAIVRSLGDACTIWIAWLDQRPAAGIIVLQAANASYTRGAMDAELAGPTHANQLLHRLAIEEACTAGCRRYHMGETGTSRSLAQFKTRFGAVPVPYAEYHVERLPFTSADRKLRGAAKKLIGFRD